MSTYTKEQLIARINQVTAINKYRLSRAPDADGLAMDNELFAIALASLEAEPVACIRDGFRADGVHFCGGIITAEEHECTKPALSDRYNWKHQPLFTDPLAPVVPEDLLSAMEEVLRISDRDHEAWHQARAGIVACRAAMQGKAEPVSQPYKLPATMFKPVADLYGITSPTGSETSFTFDAVEARDFIDGGWSCQEYVELERYQAAMVNHPEDNLDMVDHSGDANEKGNSPVTPDGWVACSERMPKQSDYISAVSRHGEYVSGQVVDDWIELHDGTSFSVDELYLWMPLPTLPAAPQ
jgi:hypothetical protein